MKQYTTDITCCKMDIHFCWSADSLESNENKERGDTPSFWRTQHTLHVMCCGDEVRFSPLLRLLSLFASSKLFSEAVFFVGNNGSLHELPFSMLKCLLSASATSCLAAARKAFSASLTWFLTLVLQAVFFPQWFWFSSLPGFNVCHLIFPPLSFK